MLATSEFSLTQEALLLTKDGLSNASRNIAKLLKFFGVPWRAQNVGEFLATDRRPQKDTGKARIFCSSDVFIDLLAELENTPEMAGRWEQHVHSAFVYGGDRTLLQKLLRTLDGNQALVVNTLWRGSWSFLVHDDSELCGAMAGVRITLSNCGAPVLYAFRKLNSSVGKIISADDSAVFIRVQYRGVTVFISTSTDIIDVDAELVLGVFDVREHLFTALPAVLYVKWAFALSCWQPAEALACLIIDDPLLKPRHGFIDFRELLSLMKRHNFRTNIAFIPWNWRRSDEKTARLFRENRDYFSISVHGCDHTRAEFASTNGQLMYMKSQQALERMAAHKSATGIDHEPVMVFPHGALSEAALIALRHTRFIAAAGNESISKDPVPRAIRVSDVWDTAVMCYSNFPIFTRRSPHEGIENVAFDVLIGKPALISIHHDFCRDHYKHLIGFVNSVNALTTRVSWCSLGEAVKRSYRQQETARGIVEVDMCAREIYLENRSDYRKRFIVSKREFDPAAIRVIRNQSECLSWKFSDDRVHFEVDLEPNEKTTVQFNFHELSDYGRSDGRVPYRVRTMLRRYICELRDNYVVTKKLPVPHRLREALQSDSESVAAVSASSPNGHTSVTAPGVYSRARTAASSGHASDLLLKRVFAVLGTFVGWLCKYGETSWDHQSFFAGPLGGRAKSLYYRNSYVGTMAVAPMVFCESFLPSARRLFHHRLRFPIADAHYAMGFGFLYEATVDPAYLDKAVHFLEELERSRCPSFQEYCWGYPFDWVTRSGIITRDIPLITTTPYVYEAFLQMHQLQPRPHWKQILASIARHAASDIKSFKTSEQGSSSSYTPFGSGGVINAAAYRALLLTSASQLLSNEHYLEIAERNLNFVLETQNPDGSWFYAIDGVRDFVDHFHTCFVMKALAKIHRLTANQRIEEALARGVDYYLGNLFDDTGLPKPFSKAPRLTVYKRELYDCAECINLCLLLRREFPQLEQTLHTVVQHILDCWIKPDGSFRSRQLHFSWDNVPMHRWAQSQMFRSLAYYLTEEQRTEARRRSAEDKQLAGAR